MSYYLKQKKCSFKTLDNLVYHFAQQSCFCAEPLSNNCDAIEGLKFKTKTPQANAELQSKLLVAPINYSKCVQESVCNRSFLFLTRTKMFLRAYKKVLLKQTNKKSSHGLKLPALMNSFDVAAVKSTQKLV